MTPEQIEKELKKLWKAICCQSGGTTEFTLLTDSPGAFTGHAGESIIVNETEDGLEYFESTDTTLALDAMNIMGAGIIAEPIGNTLARVTSSTSIGDGNIKLIAIYLPYDVTLTGVKWWQVIQGVYTADNENRIGLYFLNPTDGTCTLVASSVNNGNIWQSPPTSLQSTPFSTPYSATSGIYYIGLIMNKSDVGTDPTLGSFPSTTSSVSGALFTNGIRLAATLTGQNTLPLSFMMTSTTGSTGWAYVALY